jgi:15-cis-phytoene synthase / lycopene beta-cyclase
VQVWASLILLEVAVASTIPWDSYLIRNRIWTYPPNVILGPTCFGIPVEEIFFFVIQTYNTSLLYLFMNKPTLQSTYLCPDNRWRGVRIIGQLVFSAIILKSSAAIARGGESMYMGLIFIWATPFLLMLW